MHGSKPKTFKFCHRTFALQLKAPCGDKSIQISTTSYMTWHLKCIFILQASPTESHSMKSHLEISRGCKNLMNLEGGKNNKPKDASSSSSYNRLSKSSWDPQIELSPSASQVQSGGAKTVQIRTWSCSTSVFHLTNNLSTNRSLYYRHLVPQGLIMQTLSTFRDP